MRTIIKMELECVQVLFIWHAPFSSIPGPIGSLGGHDGRFSSQLLAAVQLEQDKG